MNDTFQRLAQGAPVATAILALLVVVGLVALKQPTLIERGVFRPHHDLRAGRWWTPLTSAFLHADLAHLLFNGFTFWAFAFNLERAIGSGRFLALYATGLVVSDLGTWLVHRRDPGYATLGASGAILAVLFASIVYFPTSSLYILPIPVPIPAPIFAVGYLVLSVIASRRGTGRVNHDAHIAGAVAGVLFVALTDPPALRAAVDAIF